MTAPPVPPAGSSAAPSAGTAGQIAIPAEIIRLPQDLAARLLQAPRTLFLGGAVTGRTPDGNLQVRSQFGEITVRAGTSVPADRQVSLQIPALAGKTAQLAPAQLARTPIAINLLLPKPPAAAPTGPLQPAAGTTAATVAGQPQAIPSIAPDAARPPPQSALQPAGPGPTPSASTPAVQPTSAPATIVGAPVTTAAGQPPAAASGGTAAAVQPGTGTTTSPPSPPIAGAAAPIRAAAQPPTGQPASPAPQLGRPALSAQVVTHAGDRSAPLIPQPQAPSPNTPPAGGAPVTTQAGPPPSVTIPGAPHAAAATTAAAAIDGGRITAAARPEAPSTPLAGRPAAESPLPAESARRVPVLREAVTALSAADPTLAAQFVRSVMPQGNSQLAATLLFFLSATRGGDIRGWVGDRVATRLEDAGRADLLPRLSAELSAPPRAAPEQAAGEWRSQTIPLYQDAEPGGLTLHVRNAGDEEGASAEADSAGKRFLIDMDLSRMGPLQLDGLVRDKRLDLTVRSQAAFPERMRDDMRGLFRDAGETVGLQGGLTFQAGGHDWVTVATGRGAG